MSTFTGLPRLLVATIRGIYSSELAASVQPRIAQDPLLGGSLDALFYSGDLRASLDHQGRQVLERIAGLSDDEIVDADLDSLAHNLAEEFEVHAIDLDREDISYDQRPAKISPGPNRDPYFGPVDGTEVQFFVPFSGDKALLTLRPPTSTTVLPRAHNVGDGTIEFRYAVDADQVETATDRLEENLDLIERYAGWQQDSIDKFNESLLDLITNRLEERQAKIEEARNRLEEKGFRRRLASPGSGGRPRGSRSRTAPRGRRSTTVGAGRLDVFISHASEDKAAVARPIFEALRENGIAVWFDEAELTLGDSLRRSIDAGLARCRFGVVVLSPAFFQKEWPQRELDGLVARETTSGAKAILPVWHQIDHKTVARFSPSLADRLAVSTDRGIDSVVEEILRVLGRV